ncbi:efflux RND transporter periplasmic adaptor subunit [Pannus brasiliensis CCIBt3594]|uniref:Efflux RND transporter periplasmic adaptor subunit n=1 Tax=Pannus brasiliensis CCIBt3594 TaxID=1427578 RepID=A0AAW9QN54_9CHRO
MIPARLLPIILFATVSIGCTPTPKTESGPPKQRPTTVNVAAATAGTVGRALSYTGTTRPLQTVSVRSRVEGQLLNLTVDAGDRVTRGQELGRLDDTLLATAVRQQQAQLASLEAELGRARIEVNNAKIEVDRLELQYQQAKNDADRFSRLAAEGAIPLQQAETARTTAEVALKAVKSARSRIQVEEQVVAGILGRIAAQKSVIAQERQKQSYAVLISPLNGVVLERTSEPGNLISTGGEVLRIGDFSRVKVVVLVSELDLQRIREGRSINLTLDAFGDRTFTGRISRISPSATGTARQIPVEITLPNPDATIKGGLLARVTFAPDAPPTVIVPEDSIARDGEKTAIFVLSPASDRVEKRSVRVGEIIDGRAEILSGLERGERFVVNSSKPLKDGEKVRVSVLSK